MTHFGPFLFVPCLNRFFDKKIEVFLGITLAYKDLLESNPKEGDRLMSSKAIVQNSGLRGKDRRRFPRVAVGVPIGFRMKSNATQRASKVYALDISPRGLRVKTEKPSFEKGQRVTLHPEDSLVAEKAALKGVVKWVKNSPNGCQNGIFLESPEGLALSLLSWFYKSEFDYVLLDAMLDALAESAFLVDDAFRIISVSKRQYLVPVDRDEARGKNLNEIPSILKLFPMEQLNVKQDLQEVLYTQKDKCYRAIPLEYSSDNDKDTYFFNICFKYMKCSSLNDAVLIQLRDVTALHKLKDNIEKKNKNLFEQYRFTLMGHIVDELLDDIISPLSAVVGRIDLLKMKMARQNGTSSSAIAPIGDWLKELETIDDLVDQITQYCTVAAKRREREKLGVFQKAIVINKLIHETLKILSVHERFRNIDIELDLQEGLPEFKGEYFDWLNALIAILQLLSREMQAQHEKMLSISTKEEGDHLVVAISHNARALKMPIEKEPGLAILDYVQKKYDASVNVAGGNGKQTITFCIPISSSSVNNSQPA